MSFRLGRSGGGFAPGFRVESGGAVMALSGESPRRMRCSSVAGETLHRGSFDHAVGPFGNCRVTPTWSWRSRPGTLAA